MEHRVLSPEAFTEAVALWVPELGIGFDLETNSREAHVPGSRIVGLSLAGRGSQVLEIGKDPTGFYIPLAHQRGTNADPATLDTALQYLSHVGVVPYYLPFEVLWVKCKWGVRLHVVGDAYIAGRLLHSKDPTLKGSVETVLGRTPRRFLTCLPTGIEGDFSFADADDPTTIAYATDDAINALLLRDALEENLQHAGLRAVYQLEIQAAVEMALASAAGYAFDMSVYRDELLREKTRIIQLEREIFRDLGGKPFLINSGPQLGARLEALGIHSTRKTTAGAPSWSKEVLTELAPRYSVIPKLIEWRSSFAVKSQMEGRADQAVYGSERVHPRWNPMGLTGSARFSCESPPMPTLATAIRRAFVAPPGQVWVRLAWEQPELRVLAVLAKDAAWAAHLQGDPFVMKGLMHERAETKQEVYEWIRCAGDPARFHARLPHAGEFCGHMDHWFPGLKPYLEGVAQEAVETGYIRGWMQRRYQCKSQDPEGRRDEALDALLSQAVATLLKVALVRVVGVAGLMPQAFKGFSQPIPCFDTLYYTIDESVFLSHLPFVVHEFQLNLLQAEGGDFSMKLSVGTGLTWGAIQPYTLPWAFMVD